MAGLLSLPDELLSEIYIFAGQQMKTLIRLSAVNRRLRNIWLGDADSIIAQAVQLYTPNHQDVFSLTRLEARFPLPTTGFHALDDADQGPPLRLCLPPLTRNIVLASEVCSQVHRDLGILLQYDPDNPECDPATKNLEPLYYLVRRFLIAYHWPSLRPPLYAALKAMTDESLKRFTQTCLHIIAASPGIRPQNHLLYKPVEQHSDEDFLVIGPPMATSHHIADMWAFAHHVGMRVKRNRNNGLMEEPGAGYHAFGGKI
jgi:hypothetical protein